MSDELQVALTSASVDPIDTLKTDLGIKDAVNSEPTKEVKLEVEEPKAEPKEEGKQETKSNENKDADDTNAEKKEQKRNSYDKKLGRQAAANRRQLETISDLKAKLESFEKSQKVEQVDNIPKKPNIDDFDDYGEYAKAEEEYNTENIEHQVEKRLKEREHQRTVEGQEAEQAAKMQEMESAFEERESRFKARHKNYDRNAQSMLDTLDYLPEESLKGAQALREYIAKSDVAPELIHHLGSNPDLIEDIASRDLIGVIEGLYDIKKSLVGQSSVSKRLPEPIDKLKHSNEGVKSMEDMSYGELKKRFNL